MRFIFLSIFIFIWVVGYTQTELWGYTPGGGINNVGTIFKTDGSGNNHVIEHGFIKTEAENPWYTNLLELPNGNLYGLTTFGGSKNAGTLFEYSPVSNTLIIHVNFSDSTFGSCPKGSLILASDGNLYGMTSVGGANGVGTIFQFNPQTNSCIKKFDFYGVASGSKPQSSLIQATDGNLYGVTNEGGVYNFGVLFKYDFQNSQYTKLFDFDGVSNGQNPIASLCQHSLNGLIYGTTFSGGANSVGVIFEYNLNTNQLTKKLDFDIVSGYRSYGSLFEAPDGMLYGLTQYGGVNNMGVLYQFNVTTNTLINKIDFAGSTNGSAPYGNLALATDGNLYGMTSSGGTLGNGTLFQYNYSTNTLINKKNLSVATGCGPFGSLMQSSNGKLYGLTYYGGTFEVGTLIEYNLVSSVCAKKKDLGGVNNGKGPCNTLVYANDGNIYGIASSGGLYNRGVIFRYNPISHTYSTVFNFNTSSGIYPGTALFQASDGKLYGMTNAGGVNDYGTFFRFDIATGVYTKLVDFNSTNGKNPSGHKFIESHGRLYGITQSGGNNNVGVIFMYDISNSTYSKLYDFDLNTGGLPFGGLTEALDGNFYGMTQIGGIGNQGAGVLFQFNPANNSYAVKYNFVVGSGGEPKGSLVLASDGKLYGMTYNGGVNNFGTIIQYNPATSALIKKFDFNGVGTGKWPDGSLMQAADGNLYGVIQHGGAYGFGTMFQYNPITNVFTKKIDFNSTNGWAFGYGNLIEIPLLSTSISENFEVTESKIYPNPNDGNFFIKLTEDTYLQLFNSLGEVVLDKNLQAGENLIAIPSVANGIYFIKLKDKKGIITSQKIVIHN